MGVQWQSGLPVKYMVIPNKQQWYAFIYSYFLCFICYKRFYIFFYQLTCIFGCTGSSLLHGGSLQLWRAGLVSRCVGLSLQWPPLLQSTGSRSSSFSNCGTQAQQLQLKDPEHGLSSCGTQAQLPLGMQNLLDQVSSQCPLYWQADSYPLYHQGSPDSTYLFFKINYEVCQTYLKI